MDRFTEYIKVKRNMRNLTQKELANKAGIGVNTLIKIEKGEANPTLSVLRKIYEALGLEISVDDKTVIHPQIKREISSSMFMPDMEEEDKQNIKRVSRVIENYSRFADKDGKVKIPVMAFVMLLTEKETCEDNELDFVCSILEKTVYVLNTMNDHKQFNMRIENFVLSENKDYISFKYVLNT